MVVRVLNTPGQSTKITLRRDAFLGGAIFGHDQVVSKADLFYELQRRNVETEVPLFVQYETKNCWDITLTCTPGIAPTARLPEWGEMTDSDAEDLQLEEVVDAETSSDEDADADAAVKLAQQERRKARAKAREERQRQHEQASKERDHAEAVLKLCHPAHRLIVTVEQCMGTGGSCSFPLP